MDDKHLSGVTCRLSALKLPNFEYLAPDSLEAAVLERARLGDRARILAGGQSLLPMLGLRLTRPGALLDLNRVEELSYIEDREGGIAVGAMTRQRQLELSPLVGRRVPLLPAALRYLANFQIRNRGTVGGSVAHADPAAELPAVLRVLDGRVTVRSGAATARTIAAEELFEGRFETAIRPDEILTEVFFPAVSSPRGWGFREFARRHGDPALAGAAATVDVEDGRVTAAAISLLAAGGIPLRAATAERALIGAHVDEALNPLEEAVRADAKPQGNIHGSAEYRRQLAGVMARRAMADAIESAQ
jgi:carbon-monoxide dehydrogenase medium subunit